MSTLPDIFEGVPYLFDI